MMKRKMIFNVIVLMAAMSLFNCAGNAPDMTLDLSSDQYETRIYEVFGMDCPGCHGGVEKLVKNIPVIKHAEANWEKKQIVVYLLTGADLPDETVYDAITRANLTVGERLQ